MVDNSVFIVDDDPIFRGIFDKMLQIHHYKNVIHFESGEDCIKMLRNNDDKPSLIFLDLSLGGLNGLDVLKRIKLISENIKVAIVTSIDSTSLRDRCLDSGAFVYINKKDVAARIPALSQKLSVKATVATQFDLSNLCLN